MHKSVVSRTARLGKLFFSMLYISSFTFGGGFVIATFMKEKFVDELHWIDEKEMLDITALAQSSPGAIAVNVAILVGWQVDGLLGMFLAVLGTIIPPMVTLSVISLFYAAFASNVYVAFAFKRYASRRCSRYSGCCLRFRPKRSGNSFSHIHRSYAISFYCQLCV